MASGSSQSTTLGSAPVTTRTTGRGWRRLSFSATTKPSIIGMTRSSTITPYCRVSIRSSASFPSPASSTLSPRSRRTVQNSFLTPPSSSTTRTRFCCSAVIAVLSNAERRTICIRSSTLSNSAGPLPDALAERRIRIDVHRHVLRGLERRVQLGRHLVVLREPRLGAGPIARRFDLEQLLRQRRQGVADLRFLEAGVRRTDGLADVDALSVAPREGRPEAVGDLVHHHGGEIAFRRNVRGLVRTHQQPRHRQDHVVDARVHVVLEEDLLA